MANNGVAQFLDQLIETHKLKNDAALARACHVGSPVISKLRHNGLQLRASMMRRIHDALDTPIKEMRAVAAAVVAAAA